MRTRTLATTVLYLMLICLVTSKKSSDGSKPSWAHKDIQDFNDADIERLYDQWDEDEEPLEDDELPEHLRKGPQLDMSSVDLSNPESLLKMSKKGKTLMTFVTVRAVGADGAVRAESSRLETERVTALWQTSLQNSHIIAERYLIDDNRAIFMFKDGAQAWEAKDFFVEQPECEEVTIENKPYFGRHSHKHKQEL